MGDSKNSIPTERLAQYNELIAANVDYERKGKTTPYTSVNGHMFSFLSKTGVMGMRLSKEDRATFMQQHDTQLMEQHGRVMKEFVEVPPTLLADTTDELSGWLKKSFDHTTGLKPKPTKK